MTRDIFHRMNSEEAHSHLQALFAAAIDAVNPGKLVQQAVQVEKTSLVVHVRKESHRFPLMGRVFVIGAGKGAGLLAQGLEEKLEDRIAAGIVVLPHGQGVLG